MSDEPPTEPVNREGVTLLSFCGIALCMFAGATVLSLPFFIMSLAGGNTPNLVALVVMVPVVLGAGVSLVTGATHLRFAGMEDGQGVSRCYVGVGLALAGWAGLYVFSLRHPVTLVLPLSALFALIVLWAMRTGRLRG